MNKNFDVIPSTPRKRQADRLLRHLPLAERKRQRQIRAQIRREYEQLFAQV